MSHPKLLKAPARVLLLTFVMSARLAAAPMSTPQITPMSAPAQHLAPATRSRVRQPLDEMDAYVLLHGIQRWGLNE